MPVRHQPILALSAVALFTAAVLAAQDVPSNSAADPAPAQQRALVDRAISSQHRNDLALDLYERVERTETRKNAADPQPLAVETARVFPAGTGTDRISLGHDAKPLNAAAYRRELQKLERALAWTLENGRAQREAYEKVAKRRKERADFVDATRTAFNYTWLGRESRNGRTLAKYRVDPNPGFRPTSRATGMLPKVRGVVWVDEASGYLARIEAEIAEDISFGGGVIAKVYKGGRFVMEQAEVAPDVWLPTLYQYDFEGRKFLFRYAVHTRTIVTGHRRVGPPKEALPIVRPELSNSSPLPSDP